MSTETPHDDLLESLGDLPAIEVDDLRAERVRRLAHAELERRRTQPWRRKLRRGYRAVEPVLVFGAAAAYMLWAFQSVLAGYQ